VNVSKCESVKKAPAAYSLLIHRDSPPKLRKTEAVKKRQKLAA
jgi:hypothetical protein